MTSADFSTRISILRFPLAGEIAALARRRRLAYMRGPPRSPPMSYLARDDRPADKAARYAEVETEILAVLEGEPNRTARMATVASMLADAFPAYFWTGFYVVDPERDNELVVGPYQGTLGCLRIPFGRGVCGAAAATGQTQVVEDVHAFPGHIACDSRSASEIVAPVFDASGALIAVFDVDAVEKAAFDAVDAEALERLLGKVFAA
jgi:L-methionine (R)-S-oxide reductase